jgi:hypothetical protein
MHSVVHNFRHCAIWQSSVNLYIVLTNLQFKFLELFKYYKCCEPRPTKKLSNTGWGAPCGRGVGCRDGWTWSCAGAARLGARLVGSEWWQAPVSSGRGQAGGTHFGKRWPGDDSPGAREAVTAVAG